VPHPHAHTPLTEVAAICARNASAPGNSPESRRARTRRSFGVSGRASGICVSVRNEVRPTSRSAACRRTARARGCSVPAAASAASSALPRHVSSRPRCCATASSTISASGGLASCWASRSRGWRSWSPASTTRLRHHHPRRADAGDRVRVRRGARRTEAEARTQARRASSAVEYDNVSVVAAAPSGGELITLPLGSRNELAVAGDRRHAD
jgi:hypothetical protein